MQRLGTAFNGFTIEASDGKVGNVRDFLFDDHTWMLRWLVVDTGTWLSGRKILIHPSSLHRPDMEGRAFEAALTREQVEKSPDIQRNEPVSQQMERNLYGYYGYNPSWGGGFYAGDAGAYPVRTALHVSDPAPQGPAGTPAEPTNADPHLRSVAEVKGYDIRAIDGEVGHLEDFLIDDEDWSIRYLVIDTRNWWFGKHVVVSPGAIKEINWAERFIRLDLTCYKIKGSPPWDQTGLIDRAYEALLHTYYGWGTMTEGPVAPVQAVEPPPAVKPEPAPVAE